MKTIFFYCFFNVVLFAFCLLLLKPLFNSGDDVFCLYLLGGGFGFEPTALVNYNYLLNPALTIIIKNLFILHPDINWYTWMLLVFHYAATTVILILIGKGKSVWKTLALYAVLFLVFEAQFLLSISFTNTSIILTYAGIITLASVLMHNLSLKYEVLCVFLFAVASLFRVYSIFPFVAIALPFFFYRKKYVLRKFSRIAVISAILIIAFNQFHQYYYKKNIQNWADTEKYQQLLYKYFNREGLYNVDIPQWKTEQELIKYALIFDTTYLNSSKLKKMYDELATAQISDFGVFKMDSLKWLIINNRIYIVTLLFFSFFLIRDKRIVTAASISFIFLCGGIFFLGVYLKLPGYIIPGGIGLICFLIIQNTKRTLKNKVTAYQIPALIIWCFLILWACIRLYKVSAINQKNNARFINIAREVKSHEAYLFFVQDNNFPIDYFYIFDAPKKYELKNVIQGFQYSEELNVSIMRSFNTSDIKDVPDNENILFWGKPVQSLLDYFEITTGKKYTFSEPLDEYKYGEVRKLVRLKD